VLTVCIDAWMNTCEHKNEEKYNDSYVTARPTNVTEFWKRDLNHTCNLVYFFMYLKIFLYTYMYLKGI